MYTFISDGRESWSCSKVKEVCTFIGKNINLPVEGECVHVACVYDELTEDGDLYYVPNDEFFKAVEFAKQENCEDIFILANWERVKRGERLPEDKLIDELSHKWMNYLKNRNYRTYSDLLDYKGYVSSIIYGGIDKYNIFTEAFSRGVSLAYD